MYIYRDGQNYVCWTLKIKPEESKALDKMIELFYKLGLIDKPRRSTFMKFCIQKTCKDVLSALEEINIGKERNW